MEPGKTSFFQALGVPTKIARGTIEITTDLKLVEAGSKVGASEATLLNMLNISPFTYGMSITQVYEEGQTFSPDVLDIEPSQLLKTLNAAIATITTISLAANYPTLPSVMHSLINSYKNVLSVAIETDYSWEGIDQLKDRIANPDAYASEAPAAGAADASSAPAEAAEEEQEASEKEESEDEGKLTINSWKRVPSEANLHQDLVVSLTRCDEIMLLASPCGIHPLFVLHRQPELRRQWHLSSGGSLLPDIAGDCELSISDTGYTVLCMSKSPNPTALNFQSGDG
jgi:60s Acidic ribosomal protein/Insertion domain in 60S ribosomal protein L10P